MQDTLRLTGCSRRVLDFHEVVGIGPSLLEHRFEACVEFPPTPDEVFFKINSGTGVTNDNQMFQRVDLVPKRKTHLGVVVVADPLRYNEHFALCSAQDEVEFAVPKDRNQGIDDSPDPQDPVDQGGELPTIGQLK